MFRIFQWTSQSKLPKTGTTPPWLEYGEYTFEETNKARVLETDEFNKVTQGRPAEMLDDDNVAWDKPSKQRKPKRGRNVMPF